MIDLSPWKPLSHLTPDEMNRLSTEQFRERYPEEYAEQERLAKLDPMNQICSCGKRGMHWCAEHATGTLPSPRVHIYEAGDGEPDRIVMDDGTLWELHKCAPEATIRYRWVLVCEGPKR